MDITIGSNTLQKGEVREGKQLVAWDCVQECDLERCPINETCTYRHLAIKNDGKCSLQIQYLQAFTDMVFSTYRCMTEDDMFKVGMHLVPLYSQLCRQKIVELSVKSVTYEDNKGVTRIHPIYKEMRDTMKTISTIWKDLGVIGGPNPALPLNGNGTVGRAGYGDPTHYANISKNDNDKKGLIR